MTDELKEVEEVFETFCKCAQILGWNCIAIPKVDDEDDIPGVIIGNEQYVNDIIEGKYKEQDFEKIG